jgi:hypothetical protein
MQVAALLGSTFGDETGAVRGVKRRSAIACPPPGQAIL